MYNGTLNGGLLLLLLFYCKHNKCIYKLNFLYTSANKLPSLYTRKTGII